MKVTRKRGIYLELCEEFHDPCPKLFGDVKVVIWKTTGPWHVPLDWKGYDSWEIRLILLVVVEEPRMVTEHKDKRSILFTSIPKLALQPFFRHLQTGSATP